MNIKTYHSKPPIPSKGQFDWTAIDENSYDGAPDSVTRHLIGYGITEQQAIDDLKEKLHDNIECKYSWTGLLVNGLIALWIGIVLGMLICLIKYR